MNLTTEELIDILQTYHNASVQGFGSYNPSFEASETLQHKIRDELARRGITKTCSLCHQYLYPNVTHPTYDDHAFCFGRCKEVWISFSQSKKEE
ncbi:hypothetical protein IMZ31_19170 (plasmid) [Pontibacillus sp. ALD_SL1]|uniref:hypothetical protein n=1 Tax=Pontibacillus sp. ALD_SL1 TaxID=2777185 RepID=UPI001A9736C8|nr:hypothetical protein [Pontibacillus sp. ALD_SL1]QST02672.1 hypothetical protein IMZ31_19170 [Pontibacillus sp. ALD_SL1]